MSPYVGPSFSAAAIDRALRDAGISATRASDEEIERTAARLIADGHVVGWFDGRMEFGPRALGHRSLFGDPRTLSVTAKLCFVKHRYAFDPFAPCVLEERLGEWFELPDTVNWSSPYMAVNYRVLGHKRTQIPAVVHVDGTSRVQAVSPQSEPRVYRLIKEYERLTGTPVLLNTSFNDREPIVCTPADAIRTSLRSGVDYLVLGHALVDVRGQVVATTVPDIPLELYFEKLR